MYQPINVYQFRDAFLQSDTYKNNFSYDGLTVLFNWFEEVEADQGQEIQFDMVGVCCEFAEATPQEIMTQYNIEPWDDDEGGWLAVRDYLENKGVFCGHTDTTILYSNI
jgi:hypothetical protein